MKKIFLIIFAIIFIMLGCTNKDNTKALEKESIRTRIKTIVKEKKDSFITAMKDLKSIGIAVESFMTDNYYAPDDISSKYLTTFYIKRLPVVDPWGNKYLYKKVDKENYCIASAGSDGIFEGFDQKGKYINTEGKDIIFSNGTYVYCPR